MDKSFMVCLSLLIRWYARCLKWSMQWAQLSSHRFSRLVQTERSDGHMVDLMLQYIALSLSLSSNAEQTVRWGVWCLLTVNPPLTQEGHQRKRRGFITLNILYMQTHSWPKQSKLASGLYFESICNSKHCLKHVLSLVELILVGAV